MAVWVVRAGPHGEFEEFALNSNVVGIDFSLRQSIADFQDRDDLRQLLQSNNAADQLWRFARELEIGETIILPCKQPKVVAIGKIVGDYRYEPNLRMPHIRPVDWTVVDIPRTSFDQDLLYSFGGQLTVFQVKRPNAQERIEQVILRHSGEIPITVPISTTETTDDETIAVDLDEAISDRIVERIRQKFTGHRLEYLVENILKAEGYTTLQTRQGADGGIDVVAGKGQMGFEEPWLCVQVKSGTTPVDLHEYNRLQANVQNFGAHHGLLVSLGDFTRTVRNANESSFFQIRLWGAGELTQRLLETYNSLPADIRADIPLQDRKVLLETDV